MTIISSLMGRVRNYGLMEQFSDKDFNCFTALSRNVTGFLISMKVLRLGVEVSWGNASFGHATFRGIQIDCLPKCIVVVSHDTEYSLSL